MSNLLQIARRGAALAVLLLPLLLLVWIGLSMEQARQASLESITVKRELLGRLINMSRRSNELQSALDASRSHPGRAWFLAGESEALITAQLQQRVQDIVASHGGQFLRASEADPIIIAGQDYRGLRVELSGSTESIQQILLDLESGVPYLFVTRAQMATDQSYQDEQAPLQLAIEIDVYGAIVTPMKTASRQ